MIFHLFYCLKCSVNLALENVRIYSCSKCPLLTTKWRLNRLSYQSHEVPHFQISRLAGLMWRKLLCIVSITLLYSPPLLLYLNLWWRWLDYKRWLDFKSNRSGALLLFYATLLLSFLFFQYFLVSVLLPFYYVVIYLRHNSGRQPRSEIAREPISFVT